MAHVYTLAQVTIVSGVTGHTTRPRR
ncbi:hypothetical protein EYZ11_012477 [Aspergillus tanneri]|uniref:Uncharacterized protein n=1 Tax=Aspergillus tanneri TaxID=1220188 RepID=A0A4S3J054_9EURO|nr:hypothetical protein EYZ11_012477 [Aspergillus tanneri]